MSTRKTTGPIRFLRDMWEDDKPTPAQAVCLVTATITCAGFLAVFMPVHGHGAWNLPLRLGGGFLAFAGFVYLLLSVPFIQRWIWDGQ